MRKGINIACVAIAGAIAVAGQVRAADIPVATLKAIFIDKETAAGKSKTVFVSKDPAATKGGDDVADISVTLSARYAGANGTGEAHFDVAAGESDGTSGWLVNKATVAKYVNKAAPAGPSGAKVAVIKPGKLLKLIGKTRGDSSVMDLIGAGAPTGSLYTAYVVDASGQVDQHCSEFAASSCSYKVIGGGTGRKLVCKGGVGDADCAAASPLAVCGNEIVEAGEECDDGNPDPTDGCTKSCTICGNGVVTAPETCDPPDGVTCGANCEAVGCGNGLVEDGETCDDGNTDDGDGCPATCVIEACTPNSGSDFTVDVNFAGSNDVAAITVFLDYPEGKVVIPGSGASIPVGIITDTPGFAFSQSNDLDYALRQVIVDTSSFPAGLLFRVHFETCNGAPAPTAGEFACTVEVAGDASSVEIPGVTCSVGLP
jgi:cysteine-rich repeat protein